MELNDLGVMGGGDVVMDKGGEGRSEEERERKWGNVIMD